MKKMKKLTTYLIAIMALLIISFGAKAQGGLTPLVGSAHNYTVTPESTSNTLVWSVVEASGYTINSQSVVSTTSVANITWTAAGTYTVKFSETSADGCETVVTLQVTVSNAFDVYTSSPVAVCNNADGQVNYSGSDATTGISFTVNMETGTASFNPNWEITFTLTPGTGATLTDVAASTGTLSGTGPYTLTGLSSATGSGSVDITLNVEGDIHTVLNPVLTITSAKELTYNSPDKDNDDWTATQTINSIPNTSAITTD